MKFDIKNKLFCFTPLVTLLTFITEFTLAIATLFRYGKTRLGQVVVFYLLSLSSFQLAEYMMCTLDTYGDTWERVGWIGITMLPAIGFHLVHVANHNRPGFLVYIGYLIALGLSIHLAIAPETFMHYTCTGHFVAFQAEGVARTIHYWYYVIFLAIATAYSIVQTIRRPKYREMNLWIILGYVSFIGPAILLATISKAAASGVPSIMCGFAIIAAVIVFARVLPLSRQR